MMRIYLAGFDVFRPDATAHGDHLKQLCASFGHEGLFPLDNAAPSHLSGAALAQWICRANLQLIDNCDLVMANANHFRGHEPDSGTVFEMGYAHAKGKPVWAYTDQDRDLLAQTGARWHAQESRHVDSQGYTVEDFGLPLNLMLACTARIVTGDACACLKAIADGAAAD
ncbi:nucleoside 2-deoxyribosyltransferase [Paracandidimonas soli]|nr:nucleoside 2-deoxyribosyltransferase [Paracandidimonas soli]